MSDASALVVHRSDLDRAPARPGRGRLRGAPASRISRFAGRPTELRREGFPPTTRKREAARRERPATGRGRCRRRRRARGKSPSGRRSRRCRRSCSASASERGRRLVEHLGGSRSGPSTRLLEQGDRGVREQQARDHLVDAAVLAQRTGERNPGSRRRSSPPRTARRCRRRCPAVQRRTAAPPRRAAEDEGALAADDVEAGARGQRDAQAVSISGAARWSVFCHENQSPNAPLNRIVQVPRPGSRRRARRSRRRAATRRPGRPGKQMSRAFTARPPASSAQAEPIAPSTR